ncbi:MAG: DUF1566 domain-containing protein [Deltaproteobacteria bacterium]|nr:MAG: DUF1566 domain-containing protein [Deltaproteobacteria bacterium]
MTGRALALTAMAALLGGACVESLGVTERKWACSSDADCVAGWVCRPDPAGSGLSVCLSEEDPAACSFTAVDSASVGLPSDLLAFERFRFIDALGRGELSLWAVEPDAGRAWVFEHGPTGFAGHVAAHDTARSATFGDLDGDGDEDAWLFGGDAGPALRLNGGDHFHVDASAGWGLPDSAPSVFAAVLDVDGDGDLDVISGGEPVGGQALRLHRSESSGVVDGTAAAGLATSSWLSAVAIGDLDGDGDADLVASSHRDGREIHVFRNDGGRFVRAEGGFGLAGPIDDSSGAALGDYDGDGDLDLLITNYHPEDALRTLSKVDGLFAGGEGGFVKQSPSTTGLDVEGLDGLDGRFWDYDSDGDLDVVIGSYGGDRIQIYRNDGDGRFVRTDAALGIDELAGADEPPAIGDYDGDGDLDLVYDGALYRNDCPARGWIALRVEVANPDGSARVAIGARVVVDPTRDGFRFPGSLLREVTSPDNGYWLHVGLGAHSGPVDAQVVFPGPGDPAGRTVVFHDLPTQRRLVLRRDGSVASCDGPRRGGGCREEAAEASCEVGYAGADCSACAAPYDSAEGGACVAPPGCKADGGWLVAGQLPADSALGRFSPGGTVEEPTVLDASTGLEWRRCPSSPSGKGWDAVATRCVPTEPYPVADAEDFCRFSYAGGGWRLPSLREMETLLDYEAQLPSLDPTAFSGVGYAATYWTSTADAVSGDRAVLDVFVAATSWAPLMVEGKESARWATCVRGGGDATWPRFAVDAADGATVRDRWTGLEWTRCALGQRWEQATETCEGDPAVADLQGSDAACAALAATGVSAFRLPTARELRSLRSFCEAPYFDAVAFGLTPPVALWTRTLDPALGEDRLHTVTLGSAASASRATDEPGPALCVR